MDFLVKNSLILQEALLEKDEAERRQVYHDFLTKVKKSVPNDPLTSTPDFDTDLSWINTTERLSIHGNLKGKVVVLDFWTYCCINCMHILPDLHELEKRFSVQDGVVIIGVHSAKFPNERVHDNIKNAVHRYGIEHAVVNDSEAKLWSEMGIQCWPTVVVIGPDGTMLSQFVGEGHRDEMIDFVGCVLDVFGDEINHESLPISLGTFVNQSALFYPTKVLAHMDKLIISDAGHHRIIVCSLDGELKIVIGSGESGHLDGNFNESQLMSPQGVCVVGDAIFVADSDSHRIRKIDLVKGTVSTVTGTGELGSDRLGGRLGCQQVISSPWDVRSYNSKTHLSTDADMLLIAMAGTHQIWSYFLDEVNWWKRSVYPAGACAAIVGSGREENRNNSYPMKAGLAQPSGLSVDSATNICYIADSESSTVRQLSLQQGQVKGMLGGALNPTDLFAFGDADGKGTEAQLQHPLDVCCIPQTPYIVICDSYNHKLKLLNTKTKVSNSLPISGLNEPGGLSFHEATRTLYIADTNNHCIKIVTLPADLDSVSQLDVQELTIEMEDAIDSPRKSLFNHNSASVLKITNDPLRVSSSQNNISLTHQLPENCHLTDDAQSNFHAECFAEDGATLIGKSILGEVTPSKTDKTIVNLDMKWPSLPSGTKIKMVVEVLLYYCSDSSKSCKRQCILMTQQVDVGR